MPCRMGLTEGSTVGRKRNVRRGLVQIVGFVALAALPVLALNSLATADTGGSSTTGTSDPSGTTRPARPQLTDTQGQCLADQGVTLPTRPADGSRPEVSQEQRDALRAAAEKCGLPAMGPRGHRPQLTDAQRQCLADQGVTLPTRPADGSRPEVSQEQREALRAAAEKCGLPAGPHGRRGGGLQGTV